MGVYREADRELEPKYGAMAVKRIGDEWNGTVEERFERRIETKTLSIQHAKDGNIDITENTMVRERASENWKETGEATKKMHFSSGGRLLWCEFEFYFGGWKFPIVIDVDKENRLLGQLPRHPAKARDAKETDALNSSSMPIIGGFPAAVSSVFRVEGELVRNTQKTSINTGRSVMQVNVEKLYDENDMFVSISAEITHTEENVSKRLREFLQVSDDEKTMAMFLSQEKVRRWRKETELKAKNLG